MAKTNTAPEGRQDTTGIISEDTRLLLRDMIRRGVTCIGITGLGRDAKEDIRAKENMIRARVDRGDETGSLRAVMDAYKAHCGRRLWVCTAADSRPRTLGWSQDVPDASPEDIFGTLYMAVRCDTWDIRDDVRAVLSRTGLTGIISLPDKILLTPISVRQEQMETAGKVMDALDIITGGGVHMVDAADYICITEPEDTYRQGAPMAGISALSSLTDMTDPERMWVDPASEGLLDPDDARDYCADWGIEITDDFGGEAYRGYYRYRTKYGLILQEECSMRISLVPAAGSRISTWAELYRTGQAKATDEDREKTRALVDELRTTERKDEPRFITLDYALDHEDDVPDVTYIPTGVKAFDNAWLGFGVGKVTVLTGYSGHGKSTFLIQAIANMINDSHRVVIYGGEGTWLENLNINLCNVLAGKENLVKIIAPNQDPADPNAAYQYMRRPEVKKKIRDWQARDRRIWLYDSDCYGSDAKEVTDWCKRAVKEHHADVLILDNLMKMGLTKAGNEANNKLVDYINSMSQYAKKAQVAVVMVAHPIKDNRMLTGGKRLLTMDDIKGCVEVSQLVDKVMIVYANRTDFKDGYEARYGKGSYDLLPEGDGYIVVDKVRGLPQRPDLFLPIFFEPGTCRILSKREERYTYGWEALK